MPNPWAKARSGTASSRAVRSRTAVQRRISRPTSAWPYDERPELFLGLVVLYREAAGEIRLEREPGLLARRHLPLDVVAVQVDPARGVGGDPEYHPVALGDGDFGGFHAPAGDPDVELARLRPLRGRVRAQQNEQSGEDERGSQDQDQSPSHRGDSFSSQDPRPPLAWHTSVLEAKQRPLLIPGTRARRRA